MCCLPPPAAYPPLSQDSGRGTQGLQAGLGVADPSPLAQSVTGQESLGAVWDSGDAGGCIPWLPLPSPGPADAFC